MTMPFVRKIGIYSLWLLVAGSTLPLGACDKVGKRSSSKWDDIATTHPRDNDSYYIPPKVSTCIDDAPDC